MIKPTQQYDDRPGYNPSRDFAKNGFSLFALERMLSDCANQPEWRLRADLANAYYDGNQLSVEQKRHARKEGLEERCTNLIRPIINSVLGQEAKSRTDVKVEADDDSYSDVGEVISGRLKEAERETRAHMAVSNSYGSGVKGGIGWVGVSRNSDPLAYPYRVESVHRNEIWWDWIGQRDTTLDYCRWLVRKRWIDLDEIQAAYPEYSEVLARSVEGWNSIFLDGDNAMLGEPASQFLMTAFDAERKFNVIARHDWVDGARKMVKMYEVWYRVPAIVAMIQVPGGKKIQYDAKDPRHVEAVARNLVKITKAVTSQIRMSLYAGPHRLIDEPTTKRNFPYYPFFAFRDDLDKSPYGLIDGMISPQDEYNERRLRIQWMLKARQVYVDSDALDAKYNSLADIADAVMRPDLVAVLNPHRTKEAGLQVKNDLSMQPEQFKVMTEAKELIQDVAGRYSSQLGNPAAGVTSGIANHLLIDQGDQAMGELNDNYSFFRRSVFEGVVDLIAEDHQTENMAATIGIGSSKRTIYLNSWDPQTQQPVNVVKDAAVKVALAEIPSTPAFKMQQQNMIAGIIKALGGNAPAVAVLAPSFIEATSLPDRQAIADDLRKVSGLPVKGDKIAQQEAEQQQKDERQAAQASQQQQVESKLAADAATSRLKNAQAGLIERTIASNVDLHQAMATVGKTVTAAQLDQAKAGQVVFDAANQDELINQALADALAA